MQLDDETLKFLKEREEKLGGRMKMRTYALYYLSGDGEKREYGVFIYTDGSTFIFEDFYRPPTFLGIEIKRKDKEEYVKMEHSFKKEDVLSASIVSMSDAIRSVEKGTPCKEAGRLTRFFQENTLGDNLKKRNKILF